jgi:hypothetical protein
MSGPQGTDDSGHGIDNLLGHDGEYLVLAPVRVNDIGQIRGERGFETPAGSGLLGDQLDPATRSFGGDRGTESVEPIDEIGKVTESEYSSQRHG